MKVSVSLSDEDLDFVDEQTQAGIFSSRSAALQAGIRLLRERQYTDSYAAAWDEWDASADAVLWDGPSADGVA
ncbi:MAG: type II toxin-antitoxin system ParD family antitoxin [Rhodoglobus sp.]